MSRQRLRESSVKWQNVLSKESFSEKILRLIEQKYFDFIKIKKINIKVCEAIKYYMDTALKNNIKYLEKKGFPPLKINGKNILIHSVTLPAEVSSH